MTPTAALLARIGWTGPELARRMGADYARVRWWVSGTNSRGNPSKPPEDVLAWLARVAEAVERVPPATQLATAAPHRYSAAPE